MRAGLLLLGLGACGFTASHGDVIDAPDGPPGMLDACVTFSQQLDTCALPLTGDLVLSGSLHYDTDAHALTDQNGATIAVTHVVVTGKAGMVDAIVAHSIHLTPGAQLRGTGTLPLALIAAVDVTLDSHAVVDVSAGGAGAQPACANGPQVGETDTGGAGGGGGGAFAADGGNGGNGNSDNILGQSRGGAKGHAIAAIPDGPLGGCPGAAGGNGDDPGGAGGGGGGALWIAAGNRIELAAMAGLDAGGGGGGGGMRSSGSQGDAGGGGGGAGGMILVETPRLVATAGTIAANGGGGGEGSGNDQFGNAGTAGLLATDRASGGGGHSDSGSDGALGGSVMHAAGDDTGSPLAGGGGGGGGGVGFIRILAVDSKLGVVSPAPQ